MMGAMPPTPSISRAVNLLIERDVLLSSISIMLGVSVGDVVVKVGGKSTKDLYAIKYKVATWEIKNLNEI